MQKQLQELTKEELIVIIQDYQEMVSEIEEKLNNTESVLVRFDIRAILDKYLWMILAIVLMNGWRNILNIKIIQKTY